MNASEGRAEGGTEGVADGLTDGRAEERSVTTVAACSCFGSDTVKPFVGKIPVLLRAARNAPDATAFERRDTAALLAAVGSFCPDLPTINLMVKLRVTWALSVVGRVAWRCSMCGGVAAANAVVAAASPSAVVASSSSAAAAASNAVVATVATVVARGALEGTFGITVGAAVGLEVTGAADGFAVGTTPPVTLVTVTVLSLRPARAPGPVLRLSSTAVEKAALAADVVPPKAVAVIPVSVCTSGMLSCSTTSEVGSAVGLAAGRVEGWREGWHVGDVEGRAEGCVVGWLVGRRVGC